jgi:uncharacterized membrane protein YbhN (UPF0104 family)
MNQEEIYDLLEINAEQETPTTEVKQGNFVKHLIIHLGILFLLIGIPYYLIEIDDSSNDELAFAILFAFLFLVFFVVLIVEIIYYQIKKKFQLRNSALITILISILTAIIALAKIGF